jgi:hypothetical protein
MTTLRKTSRRRKTFKFGLLDNGIDFIRSGLQVYFLRDTPKVRAHKYALLHVFAGVLLLMKERLRRSHKALVFDKVSEADKPDAKTVSFDEALNRLRRSADVSIKETHIDTLRRAQKVRNRLEHYEFSINLQEARDLIGRLCEFSYVFLKKELKTDLQEKLPVRVWRRVEQLRGIAAELEMERENDWRERAKAYLKLSDDELADLPNGAIAEPQFCPACESKNETLEIEDVDVAVCTNPSCRRVFRVWECASCERYVVDPRQTQCKICLDTAEYYFLADQGIQPPTTGVG